MAYKERDYSRMREAVMAQQKRDLKSLEYEREPEYGASYYQE